MKRQVCHFDFNGTRLQGTFHPVPASANAPGNVGILFTNAGLLPRSARGDLATRFADMYAEWGYPSFRFDLPGLGDSSGEVPVEVLGYYEQVQTGHFAEATLKLSKALCERHQLSGMVLFGHCGSATTAAFAKLKDQDDLIKGLILLDPSFILYQAVAPKPAVVAAKTPAEASKKQGLKHRLQEMRQKFVTTKVGFALKSVFRRTKKFLIGLRGAVLPRNSNMPVINGWLDFARNEVPLVAFHADRGERSLAFDYLHYLQTKSKGAIQYISVKGTNHSFVEGPGPEAIRAGTRDFLKRHFPVSTTTKEPQSTQEQQRIAA